MAEWYPCYIWFVMWKCESGERPRIVIYRVSNEVFHYYEDSLRNEEEAYKV